MGRMQPGVNLYCQKVLIEQHSENILPEWLRFLKGVIDSEDLPLNISRQSLQDNTLVMKLRRVITKRFIKFLNEEAGKDNEKYLEFWKTFGIFIKEGITTDFEFQKDLGKLLRFESSESEAGKMVSLNEYISRMKEGQDEIYYINGPSRAAIEFGPYVEMFKKRDVEIIYTLEPIDDFVLNHLGEYEGKKLVSADQADLRLPEGTNDSAEEDTAEQGDKLEPAKISELCGFLKEILGDKVKEVKSSDRLVDSPAMIVNVDGHMTSSMERIMQAQGGEENLAMTGNKKDLEINPASPLMKKIIELKESNRELAGDVAGQVFDNAMLQAGLLVDSQQMVSRNYRILEQLG
jgi:molecular chaperone HtpG